jgi:imidazolonepropionase
LRGPKGCRRGPALHDLALIEDGSLLIRDGIIAQVGSTRRLENLKECGGAAEIDVDRAVVMPGFVDPSIQFSAFGPPPELKRLGPSAFREASVGLLRSCLLHGTLYAQVKAGKHHQDVPSTLSALRQLANFENRPVGLVRTWQLKDAASALSAPSNEFAGAFSLLLERKLAHRIELTAEASDETRALARAQDLPINLSWQGGCAKALRDAMAALQPRMIGCPHLMSAAECDALAEYSAPVVFSPCRALVGNECASSAVQLAQQGVAIALASGYDEHDIPVFNMQTAISLAVLKLGLSTEQAIVAATANAACALGLGHVTGTLEVGKRADLLVLDLSDYRELPRRFGSNHVVLAMREGRVVYNRTARKVSMP